MPAFVGQPIESIHYILCPTEISRDAVLEFERVMKDWAKSTTLTQVLDLRKVTKMDPSFFQVVAKFKQLTDKNNVRLISVNASEDTSQLIIRAGMDKIFGIMKLTKGTEKSSRTPAASTKGSATADTAKLAIPDSELRLWLVRYLIQAGRNAMNTMFNTTVAADENYREAIANFNLEKIFRASVVKINAPTVRAHFRLFFEKECLMNLVRSSVGSLNENDTEIIDSTACELLNLIYGGAKSHLNDDKDLNLPPAIPALVPMDEVRGIQIDKKSSVILPFATALGTFHLQIEFI